MTLHVAAAVEPDKAHGPLNDPVLLVVNEKVPVGVKNIPVEVSVTVTMQDDDWPVVIV